MRQVSAFAPATIANFNVGYDVLGVSLNNIGDEVKLTVNNTKVNKIIEIKNGENLPKAIEKNCCSVVIYEMQKAQNSFVGVDIAIVKGFASGSGLGSSSASSAAAAYAYNELIGQPYSTKELVHFAALGEKVACGTAHIDNVSPSLLGGIILATGSDADKIIELPVLKNLYAVTLLPDIKINTSDSRKILKDNVSLDVYRQQIGFMGSFVSSLYENNLKRFSESLKDLLIEPMRSLLIPKFDALKQSALNAGALTFGISGSGPSVFAICEGEQKANYILKALEKTYEDTGIGIQTYCNKISKNSGARIIENNVL